MSPAPVSSGKKQGASNNLPIWAIFLIIISILAFLALIAWSEMRQVLTPFNYRMI